MDIIIFDQYLTEDPQEQPLLSYRPVGMALPCGARPIAAVINAKFVPLWEGGYFPMSEVQYQTYTWLMGDYQGEEE